MRSIPFRVVCLVGLDDDTFPRRQRPQGFDLMAESPRPGDRNARDDDRHLFLEALLSARERLIVTYTGQSIRDNTERPPSVLVSELLDGLARSFALPATGVTVRHPLQAFSPRCFDGSDARVFSYAHGACAAAEKLAGTRGDAPRRLCGPLPADPDLIAAVELEDLVRFFDNPVRSFLQRRLGLYLGRDLDPLSDREPLALDALDQWEIGDPLLRRAVQGEDLQLAFAPLRAQGVLPLGTLGRCAFHDLAPNVAPIAARARELLAGGPGQALPLDIEIGGTRLSGVLREVHPAGRVEVQYAQPAAKHCLRLWIRHLALQWVIPDAVEPASWLVARSKKTGVAVRCFGPVADAGRHLRDLLDLYRLGLTRPLPFFPAASHVFAKGARADEAKDPLAEAGKIFANERQSGGVGDDYVTQVFGPELFESDHGDAEERELFERIAVQVFDPLLDHMEEDE